eukprot:TRINITY_DN3887_c0_g1_i2.p3 TRINITY_DN3887_c0_g1~~TRINITY_DN3887_c0_g1_i2.p3  ORF type:complete len:191 (+),score=9.76 TRINITY_DN3887_c0_g1_i2:482-1054(+)
MASFGLLEAASLLLFANHAPRAPRLPVAQHRANDNAQLVIIAVRRRFAFPALRVGINQPPQILASPHVSRVQLASQRLQVALLRRASALYGAQRALCPRPSLPTVAFPPSAQATLVPNFVRRECIFVPPPENASPAPREPSCLITTATMSAVRAPTLPLKVKARELALAATAVATLMELHAYHARMACSR